jgi:hypothetical protein
MEPRYVSVDDDGNESHAQHPKWSMPNTPLAKKALVICGRKYYQKGEKSRWIVIEKAMMPLASGHVSVYPSEWVEQMLSWAEKKNKGGIVITFSALLNGLENKDRLVDFVARWKSNHKDALPEGDAPAPVVRENEEEFKWDY